MAWFRVTGWLAGWVGGLKLQWPGPILVQSDCIRARCEKPRCPGTGQRGLGRGEGGGQDGGRALFCQGTPARTECSPRRGSYRIMPEVASLQGLEPLAPTERTRT